MIDVNTVITLISVILSSAVTLITVVWKIADTKAQLETRLTKIETEFQCYLGDRKK